MIRTEKIPQAPRATSNKPGKPGRPKTGREQITLMLSPRSIAIIKKLKATGAGWQDKIDAALLAIEVR